MDEAVLGVKPMTPDEARAAYNAAVTDASNASLAASRARRDVSAAKADLERKMRAAEDARESADAAAAALIQAGEDLVTAGG